MDKKKATTTDSLSWKSVAQEGEFNYHINNQWRQSEDFMAQTTAYFTNVFGFIPDQYKNKTVIDLGAGSKLRTKYFQGANIIAIEPLADRFLQSIIWSDLKDAIELYSKPAEELIDECKGRADLLISINVLDHCYNFENVVRNIAAYLKSDGLALLSFDKHDQADEMHPLELSEEICEEIFTKNGLKIKRMSKGLLPGRDQPQTYGHGPYCLNYWLTKA